MIQILTYTRKEKQYQNKNVVLNTLHDAESLDSFDINIICLLNEHIWENDGMSQGRINEIDDFKSLSVMLANSKTAYNVIILPQNMPFLYDYTKDYYGNGRYYKQCELKNMIANLTQSILSVLYEPIKIIDLVYENTKTDLEGEKVPAAFCFNNVQPSDWLTKSERSNKATTVKVDDVILSTLLLDSYEKIELFLKKIGLVNQKQECPQWMEDISMFDDVKQIDIIRHNQLKIQEAQGNIDEAKNVIEQNNEYKSILYTSGEELVKVVFKILNKMLGCSFADFEDKRREDFLTTCGDYIFIGEIKGVGPNVKSENIAQLDRHYQGYLDENPDADQSKICALLIINHQRKKPVYDREPVHETQIALAKRNGSLIVETYTLLRLFEKYLSGEKDREECISILQNNTGLLTIE